MKSSHFLRTMCWQWFTMQFNHCFKYHKFWLIVLKCLMMVGIGMLFFVQYSFHVWHMLTDCAETFTLVLVYRYMGIYYNELLDLSHMWIHSFFQLCSKIKALSPFHSKSSQCSHNSPLVFILIANSFFFVAKFYNVLFCSRMIWMLELEDSLFWKIRIA